MCLDDTAPEIWRDVVGYEGWYSVSSYGRVRRDRPGSRTSVGLILKTKVERNGYLRVQLWKDAHGKMESIHHLVAQAFIGVRPTTSHGVNHIDGVKINNWPSNLEWATPRENSAHAIRIGLIRKGGVRPAQRHPRGDEHPARRRPDYLPRGSKNGNSKLTESAVLDILTSPLDVRGLAQKYEVSTSLIHLVRARRIWKHVQIETI